MPNAARAAINPADLPIIALAAHVPVRNVAYSLRAALHQRSCTRSMRVGAQRRNQRGRRKPPPGCVLERFALLGTAAQSFLQTLVPRRWHFAIISEKSQASLGCMPGLAAEKDR